MQLFVKGKEKRISPEVLSWDSKLLNALFNGLINGDGHVRFDGRMSFVQKSKHTADLVQAIGIRLGLGATMSKNSIGSCWTIYFTEKHRTRSLRGTNGTNPILTYCEYSGKVWCPRLEKGTWIARRNGRVFITGNCFPEELAERMIKCGCPPNGVCLDPFMGSGTVAVVAKRLNRQFIGFELSDKYIKIAERRLAGVKDWDTIKDIDKGIQKTL